MYRDIIERLNPKPTFNLKWYKDEDRYSDGDVEDVIIRLIAENEPEDYVEVVYNNFSWATYYHLSRTRKNLLNWYPFDADASVLEIGCGLGAITATLCEKCRDVTAVELSKRRATATLLRCREKENLEIIVGNLNDIEFEKKFDYITLIGVLEYQGSYTEGADPYADFLKKIKHLLKPQGKLLIAIENQYGLKYWCGAREDHTGRPFDGLNQYVNNQGKVRTFSKNELERLVKRSGYKNTFFYYPMPDYKLPTVVYSQEYLPNEPTLQNARFYYVPDKKTLIASEAAVYPDIIANGVFDFFANSFLVECSDSERLGEYSFAKLCSERYEEYRIGTRMKTDQSSVEKFSLSGDNAYRHLCQAMQNEQQLKERGLNVWESKVENGVLVSEFSTEQVFEAYLYQCAVENGKEKVFELLGQYLEEIKLSSPECSWEDNIMYTFGDEFVRDAERYGAIIKTGYLDMIFRNCFWIRGQRYWFDQEWILENVPVKFIFYRAIVSFYSDYPKVNEIIPVTELAERYGLLPIWEDLRKLNAMFNGVVLEEKYMQEDSFYR